VIVDTRKMGGRADRSGVGRLRPQYKVREISATHSLVSAAAQPKPYEVGPTSTEYCVLALPLPVNITRDRSEF
jgi:hypothetical protein